MTSSDSPPKRGGFPQTVGVVGGGTAGYFAALALKRWFPELSVTQIESSTVPIIGVGEATTTLMLPFLHGTLGIDIVDLFREVDPTFKLGVELEWGAPGSSFSYAFGEQATAEALAYDGELTTKSLASRFIASNRGPIVRAPDASLLSLLPSMKLAYHLENRAFVAFLAAAAKRVGLAQIDATIADVSVDARGVSALHTTDGRTLTFDLYIDASGFRSILLGRALASPFKSFSSSMFCDRAIIATLPQSEPVRPCTVAETMDAGWCWRIPVGHEDHRGYVYSSAFLDDDAARAEMKAKNPDMGDASSLRFESGRRRDFWKRNVIGLGNAYGFVEPLQSTALHMVIIELTYVMEILRAWRTTGAPASAAIDDDLLVRRANRAIGQNWDYLRWFLALHYRFNERLSTPFWRESRARCDVSGVADLLERFRREGPWPLSEAQREETGVIDLAFTDEGMLLLLLGQRAPGAEHVTRRSPPISWQARGQREAGVTARALSHRETLEAFRASPQMLRPLVDSPGSWIHGERAYLERIVRRALATGS